MVLGAGMALRHGPLDDFVDDDAVLRVHADDRAVLAGLAHGPENGSVVDVEHPGVGHEQLVRGDALVGQVLHFPQPIVLHVRDDHVEAVVDGGLAFGLLVPGFQGRQRGLALGLNREIDQGRRTAVGGGAGAGLEIVRGNGAAEGHVQVGVRVHAARKQVLAGSIDDGVRIHAQVPADDRHCLVLDEHVGLVIVDRRYDAAILDQ
jgi:hypothetical protein